MVLHSLQVFQCASTEIDGNSLNLFMEASNITEIETYLALTGG